jgi:outer membrane protein TolC
VQHKHAAVTAGRAKAKGQEAQREGALLEAEILYWRLALAREAKKVAQDALTRAQAMHEWTTRRVRLNLSDRTEQLQSDAQLKARQLEMLQADDDERSARLNFNLARGRNDDLVHEALSEINAARIQKWKNLTRTHSRSEIEALSLQAQAAELQAQAARERTRPQLELFGQYAWHSPTPGEPTSPRRP